MALREAKTYIKMQLNNQQTTRKSNINVKKVNNFQPVKHYLIILKEL